MDQPQLVDRTSDGLECRVQAAAVDFVVVVVVLGAVLHYLFAGRGGLEGDGEYDHVLALHRVANILEAAISG